MANKSEPDTSPRPSLEFRPVTPACLPDLTLFSLAHGKFRYCSCMRWRMTSTDFRRSTVAERAAALEALVRQGTPVGVPAFSDSAPVAWCSMAPRATYAALGRYRALTLSDDANAWSVVCFFIDRRWRGQRVTLPLLAAATVYAHAEGAAIVEGYPVEPDSRSYRYMGAPAVFEMAGYREVARAGATRRVMHHYA